MKETRFIELLNLYVDQQLSAPEAEELEAEILGNPARHRTYRQYCRMQKGCAQLFEHERSAAPASAKLSSALTEADRKILAFPATHSRPVWARGYGFAAVAAAACVAFVVVRQPEQPASTPASFVASAEPAPEAVAATLTMAASERADSLGSQVEFPTALTESQFRALNVSLSEGVFFNERAGPPVSSLVWMQDVQLKPIRKVSSDEFLFRSVDPGATEAVVLPMRSMEEPATEMNAFTFQR